MPGKALNSSAVGWLLMALRFHQVPTFGCDTIRRFGGNVSALKKLAARDFEDIIQVSSPFLCYQSDKLTVRPVLDTGH